MSFKIPSRYIGIVLIVMAVVLAILTTFSVPILSLAMPDAFIIILKVLTIVSGLIALDNIPILLTHIYWWKSEDGERNSHIHIDPETPIPDHMLSMANEIENLGFTFIGVKAIEQADSSLYRFWLWKDESGEITAWLVDHKPEPFAYFATLFLDGVSVETTYNFQIDVYEKYIIGHNLQTSINEAFHFHLHVIDEQKPLHGAVRIITNLKSTDITAEEYKNIRRSLYAGQIKIYGTIAAYTTILTIGSALAFVLASISGGWAMMTFCGIWGLAFTFIDYDAARARLKPVDGRKSRKAVEQ